MRCLGPVRSQTALPAFRVGPTLRIHHERAGRVVLLLSLGRTVPLDDSVVLGVAGAMAESMLLPDATYDVIIAVLLVRLTVWGDSPDSSGAEVPAAVIHRVCTGGPQCMVPSGSAQTGSRHHAVHTPTHN